jgi:hypothetical protein
MMYGSPLILGTAAALVGGFMLLKWLTRGLLPRIPIRRLEVHSSRFTRFGPIEQTRVVRDCKGYIVEAKFVGDAYWYHLTDTHPGHGATLAYFYDERGAHRFAMSAVSLNKLYVKQAMETLEP